MDSRPIVRAAWHEAAHAAISHAFRLPIATIEIRESGGGKVTYTRRFHYAEIETWMISVLAGAAIEREVFGSCDADSGDRRAIENMVRDMEIMPWSDTILDGYRQAAEKFVKQKRSIIEIVAQELLRVRRMTGSELDELLSSLSQIEV